MVDNHLHTSKQYARRECLLRNIGFFIFISIIAIIANYLFYQQYIDYESKAVETDIAFHLETLHNLCESELHEAITDLRTLADLHQLAQFENGAKTAEIVARHFISSLSHNEDIDQVRILNAKGDEILRVDRRSGSPATVSTDLLQNKRERSYFREITSLPEGSIYISPLDLNVEQGKLEIPYKPVVRFATAIPQKSGDESILIMNILGETFLSKVRDLNFEDDHVDIDGYLTNSDGYFLVGDSSQQEWGHVLPDRQEQRFETISPTAWEAINRDETGSIITEQGLFHFSTIDLNSYTTGTYDKTNSWKLVIHAPSGYLSRAKLVIGTTTGLLTLFFIMTILAFIILQIRSTYRRIDTQDMLEKMATTDYLTGIFNLRQFFTLGEHEFQRSQRYSSNLALLTFDIDHFKKVNDTYGHPAGDAVLIQITDLMNLQLRGTDIFGRLGGEEFAILLLETEIEETQMVSDRLRRTVAEHKFTINDGKKIDLTISIGCSIACPSDSFTTLFRNADAALYQAKKTGRNKTVFNNLDCTGKSFDQA